jgi:hypothetical protein
LAPQPRYANLGCAAARSINDPDVFARRPQSTTQSTCFFLPSLFFYCSASLQDEEQRPIKQLVWRLCNIKKLQRVVVWQTYDFCFGTIANTRLGTVHKHSAVQLDI